jgi:hypothetical protein
MGIRRSGLLALAGVILAGCGGSGGGSSDDDRSFIDPDTEGKAIKVSYLRFTPEQDPKGRGVKWTHTYRFLLSEGWVSKQGPLPKGPLDRLYRDRYEGRAQDRIVEELVRRMEAAGFGRLKETPLATINLESLRRIEKLQDGKAAQRTRIIMVETENSQKVATYEGNDDSKSGVVGPQTQLFLDVEEQLVPIISAYTILATFEKSSSTPK